MFSPFQLPPNFYYNVLIRKALFLTSAIFRESVYPTNNQLETTILCCFFNNFVFSHKYSESGKMNFNIWLYNISLQWIFGGNVQEILKTEIEQNFATKIKQIVI